jgi:alpha-ketoglutarate-dependent dioxygenase FTO
MEESTHDRFLRTLNGLGSDGFYKFDVNQPMGLGTKLSRTFVSRCVVGDAGITYKYLGTRIFAYPWTDGEEGATPHCVALRELNAQLVGRTLSLLASMGRPEVGSCQYNLVLVNRYT